MVALYVGHCKHFTVRVTGRSVRQGPGGIIRHANSVDLPSIKGVVRVYPVGIVLAVERTIVTVNNCVRSRPGASIAVSGYMIVFRQRQAVIRLGVRVLTLAIAGSIEDMVPLDKSECEGRVGTLPSSSVRECPRASTANARTVNLPTIERICSVRSNGKRDRRFLLDSNATRGSQSRVLVAVRSNDIRVQRRDLCRSFA